MDELWAHDRLYDLPAIYEIRVAGKVEDHWFDRLEGMAISIASAPDGSYQTTCVGELRNQGAMLDVLNTLWQHRLVLLSLRLLAVNDRTRRRSRERLTKTP